MTLFSTPGNEAVKKQLSYALQQGTIGQALLFSGPEGSGKRRMAEELANALIASKDSTGTQKIKLDAKSHPDFFLLQPQGKKGQHSIELLRHFAEESQQPPYEGAYKVFIIDQADKMAPVSANALLKSFEEPAPTTVIILITSEPEALLPTVLSRCRQIRFQPIIRKVNEEADPIRHSIFEILYSLKTAGYPLLSSQIKQLTTQIDAQRKAQEAELLKELSAQKKGGTSAFQLESLSKQQEGESTHQYMTEVERLIQITLNWIRDLHALQVGAEKQFLLYGDSVERLAHFLKVQSPPSLEKAMKAAEALRLGLDRSMSLQPLLERFFLEIGNTIYQK